MPPKAKKGKKKEEGPVLTPEEEKEVEETELGKFEADVRQKTADLKAIQRERNYMQLERGDGPLRRAQDAVSRFLDICRREVKDYDMSIVAKEREMELMEDNHRVEVRVYEQKVKHLEYEHRTAMRRVGENSGSAAATDVSEHESAEEGLRGRLAELRARLDEMEAAHAAEVRSRVTKHDRTLALTRERFRSLTDESRQRHSERLARLEEEMELRRRVELHEAEERKNQHLADMVRNHKRDFAKVKEFFNGITRKNVATIRDLRAQVQQLREKQAASQALMIDISEENRRLAEPLALATEEVLALRADLRDAPKDRLALGNVTSRLREVSHALTRARREHRTLERRFGEAESERDGLYESFEDAVRAVQRRAELRNQALERRLEELSLAFDARAAELDEAVSAARLDPAAVREVVVRVDAAIDAREARLRELHYAVARVAKAHNDALRVFAAKLQRVGADPSELDADEIPTATTTAPAGLVARPNVK